MEASCQIHSVGGASEFIGCFRHSPLRILLRQYKIPTILAYPEGVKDIVSCPFPLGAQTLGSPIDGQEAR